jgi:hypothetical protein
MVRRDGKVKEDTSNHDKKYTDGGYHDGEPTPWGCSEEQARAKIKT